MQTHCLPDDRVFQNSVELCEAFNTAWIRSKPDNLVNGSTLREVEIVSGQNKQTEVLLKSMFNLRQMIQTYCRL